MKIPFKPNPIVFQMLTIGIIGLAYGLISGDTKFAVRWLISWFAASIPAGYPERISGGIDGIDKRISNSFFVLMACLWILGIM